MAHHGTHWLQVESPGGPESWLGCGDVRRYGTLSNSYEELWVADRLVIAWRLDLELAEIRELNLPFAEVRWVSFNFGKNS